MNDIPSIQPFYKLPAGRSEQPAADGPAEYEITVAQSLSDQWATWFDGLALTRDDQGNTLLSGSLRDQAALHGLLAKIRDLNLVLLSVVRK